MQRHNTEARRHGGEEAAGLKAKAQRGQGAMIQWWVTRLLLTVILAGVALVVVPRARGFTLNDAEAFIGAALPDGAADVQFATRDPLARIVWLRFTLPPETDAAPFVAAMGLPPEIRADFTPFLAQNYTEADMTWWTPYAALDFDGLHAIHADKVYDLLLDRSDAAALIVYLRVYAL